MFGALIAAHTRLLTGQNKINQFRVYVNYTEFEFDFQKIPEATTGEIGLLLFPPWLNNSGVQAFFKFSSRTYSVPTRHGG